MYRIKLVKNEYCTKKNFCLTNSRIQNIIEADATHQQLLQPQQKVFSKIPEEQVPNGDMEQQAEPLVAANNGDGNTKLAATLLVEEDRTDGAGDEDLESSRAEDCIEAIEVEGGTRQESGDAEVVQGAEPVALPDRETAGLEANERPGVNYEQQQDVANGSNKDVPREMLFKHPLQNVWTLWYLENDRTKAWEDMQNEITSFDTVEDFWSLYHHIKLASEIKLGSDYSLFKKGIRPMWEDDCNRRGGRWVISINKACREELDNLWLDTLLCLIGEAFDHSDQICGAVLNIRGKSNKISVWTKDGQNEPAVLEIGKKLRDILHLANHHLQYQLHRDTMVKLGSSIRTMYCL